MEALKIVGFALGSACLYGISQDQVTARVCVEYFTVGHPPLVPGDSPTVLALGWGVLATWWVGLPLGFLLALACRAGPAARLTWRDLVKPTAVLLLAMGTLAATAGLCAWLAARNGTFVLRGPVGARIAAERHALFLADNAAHLAAYLAGLLGGGALAGWCVLTRWRRKPEVARQGRAAPT